MKVKEIMTKKVVSISPDANAKEALDLLQKRQISSLPVVDEEGKVVGVFTEKAVLAHILPSYIHKVGRFVYEQNPKVTKKKFTELDNIPVSKLMSKEMEVVNEDATLCEVARKMLMHKTRRIPVVDKDDKVVGIVARCDVLKAFESET